MDVLEGLPLRSCTGFAIPEVHSGVFRDEECAISKAYEKWKRTREVTRLEEVGRAVRDIIEEPVHEAPNSPADKERLVDGETKACLLYTSPSPRDS